MFVSSGNGFVSSRFPLQLAACSPGCGKCALLFDTTHSIAEYGWELGWRELVNAWYMLGDLYISPESSLQFWEINIIT